MKIVVKFDIINVVWGEKYINTFLNLSLPPQFGAGNLVDLSVKPNYVIYTDEVGKTKIQNSEIFAQLSKYTNVVFRIVKTPTKPGQHFSILLKGHSDAIKQANRTKTPIIFLGPDCIMSKGVFQYVENSLKRGKRLIACAGIRMSLERYEKIVQKKEGRSGQFVVNWSSLDLSKTTIQNLHHRSKALLMGDGLISPHPSHMYWRLTSDSLFVKAYHLHPLLIWPENHNIYPMNSADGVDFLEKVCPNTETWDVVTSCKDFSIIEVSSEKQFVKDRRVPIECFPMRYWMKENLSSAHRFFFTHDIIFGEEIITSEWKPRMSQIKREIEIIHSNKPFRSFKTHFKLACIFYGVKLKYVLTRKKTLTLKKIGNHISYLIRHKSLPYHTLPPSVVNKYHGTSKR